MPIPVKLREVAEEMDAVPEGWTAYLNRKTGELYSFPDELEALDEEDDDELDELYVDFERDELPKVREIDWLPLPCPSRKCHPGSFGAETEMQQCRADLSTRLEPATRA